MSIESSGGLGGQTGEPNMPNAQSSDVAHSAVIYHAFREMAGQPYRGQFVAGPYMASLRGVLQPISDELAAVDPSLDQSYLAAAGYYSPEMKEHLAVLARGGIKGLDAKIRGLKQKRVDVLEELAESTLVPALASQTIGEGILTETEYLQHGDPEDDDATVARGCANACFRMAYSALLGATLTAAEVTHASLEAHGTQLISNVDYLNLFHSNAIADVLGQNILTFDVQGSSLDLIRKLAANAKKKWSGAKVVCIVPYASETRDGNIEPTVVHQSVLLGATDDIVYLHDPARKAQSGPNRGMDKSTFSRRWAIGLTEAMIVVARA